MGKKSNKSIERATKFKLKKASRKKLKASKIRLRAKNEELSRMLKESCDSLNQYKLKATAIAR